MFYLLFTTISIVNLFVTTTIFIRYSIVAYLSVFQYPHSGYLRYALRLDAYNSRHVSDSAQRIAHAHHDQQVLGAHTLSAGWQHSRNWAEADLILQNVALNDRWVSPFLRVFLLAIVLLVLLG